ncbi:membrane protein [Gordonia phage ObLaDi]|uniref:Uncharacterized protein n=3 Tax=Cafassovirus TaxID=3425056 RepID=A0A9E7QBL8_9CAUD|nr:membrane protein [Gordonia phage Cafasso]UVK59823.1 hypothetical protein SEA_ALEEMILY_83 [Gordonia phage Aleemily]UXE03807.1 membrane protein [Gordonia phage ObLaDi]
MTRGPHPDSGSLSRPRFPFRRRCSWCGVQLRLWQINLCRRCRPAVSEPAVRSSPTPEGSRWDADPDPAPAVGAWARRYWRLIGAAACTVIAIAALAADRPVTLGVVGAISFTLSHLLSKDPRNA